ncbi:MAG: long-chain fatty acid--CoA ligase [Candidatus Thorarchaeota archaeon]|nr:MAG: long-chain fatty acid--CoA ligase [Candidatus Thorarchaeota archaeon]
MLDKAADKNGTRPYTLFEGASKTYAEIRDHANRIANFLASRGIKKGDRVALFLPNVPHFPAVFFGGLKAGATVVTCNPMYKVAELNFQLKDSGATAVFVLDHPTFTPTCYEAIKGTDVKTVVVCSVKSFLPKAKAVLGGALGKIPKSPSYQADVTFFYDDVIAKSEPKPPDVKVNPDDVALILYTGGTTGTPKGAALTHSNLVSNVHQVYEWVNLSPEDIKAPPKIQEMDEVFVGALPWYHSYGLTLTMLMGTYLSSRIVCIPDPRAGKPPMTALLKDLQEYKGTIFNCVPALYAGVVNHPDVKKYNLRSIKVCSSGAAPLPPELAKKFEEATGAILFEGYGLTETSPVTHINPTNRRDRKFGSIGLPIPDTICKILDVETGMKEMPIGEKGEIAVSGPQVMKGYWNKPKETEEVFRTIGGKRFFLTGDIGYMDNEGFTIISDRKKEMINAGGLKAYPREIEDALYEHPKIAMAAVIGVPKKDDPGDEYVKAFVVLKPGQTATPDEILEWAKSRLAGYKRPKEIEFVESLPLSQVGKVLRRELRKKELDKKGIKA